MPHEAEANPGVSLKFPRRTVCMDVTGFTLLPDLTGCQHSYIYGSFCKIDGMTAAKCSACNCLIVWSVSPIGTPGGERWIALKKAG